MAHTNPTFLCGSQELASWIERIKAGDQLAAAELVRHYEPEVHRFIRFRLTEPKLRRFLDSIDICQSVMARFFAHLCSGRISVEHPLQLLKLLTIMARNSLLDHVRKEKVRRGVGGMESPTLLDDVADEGTAPDKHAEQIDLVNHVRSRMSEVERRILDRWMTGCGWEELSKEFVCEPDALRKRMTRAIDRASHELGLSEGQE